MAKRPYYVFCDVDETLIHPKSMLDFLDYYFVEHHGPAGAARRHACLAELVALRQMGASREQLNRQYYRVYEGHSVAEVAEVGARWFADRNRGDELFIPETRAALALHRASGAELILVSGSFAAVLEPIAAALAAEQVLCTQMLSAAGRYTGAIEEPMIGEHKAHAVSALLARRPEVAAEDCYGYADDESDIPMLDCVGKPVAVGRDPRLLAYIARRSAP